MELEQYLKRIFRWWWLILLSTGIAAGASYYASLQQPRIYTTTTTLMVGQVIQKANPTGQDFATIERLGQSYAQMAVRQPILQATVDNLELKMGWQGLRGRVNATQLPRTQLLAITVQDNSPERAVAVADEIAHQLILQSPTSPENQQRNERGKFVQRQLDDLEARIEATQIRVEALKVELETAFSARQIQDLQTEIASLESLINNWQANYTGLLDFLQGGGDPNFLTVIEPAQLPRVPISPKVEVNVLLAAAVGFALAVAAGLLLEYIDDTVKTSDELSEILDVTTLGSVGYSKRTASNKALISHENPFSPVAEGFRILRSNIQFVALDRPVKSILVTSPEPNAGKSTTAANLGVIMAQADFRTIIVDGDLRRPSMHTIFGVPNSSGLTNAIRSPATEFNGLLKETGIENLQLITSGPLPPNPAELLGSPGLPQLLQRLETMADVIIVDSSPILAVTDALVLSNQVDGVILVTRAGRSRRDMIRRTIKSLRQARANVLGGVLSGVSTRDRDGYYYHYYGSNGHRTRG